MPATHPTSQPLYPTTEPATRPADIPTISYFPADNPDGSAIIVLPGGGYSHLAAHEGEPVALWLNTLGISSAVLRYRVAPHRHPAPFNDASRGIRTLRTRADELKLDPKRIGILGFSAGGHLAATVSTLFDAGNPNAPDPIDRASNRPDLTILCYPVITFVESFAHARSRANLLGDVNDPDLFRNLSPEHKVSPETPPAFLFHTVDDSTVKVENSQLYAAALRDHRIPHEVHLYEHGPHGVGLARDIGQAARNNPTLATWTTLCANWLKTHKFGRGA